MTKSRMPPTDRASEIGPLDHGRRMSLAEFEDVDAQEGFFYELANGVIEVSAFPHRHHCFQLMDLRDQLEIYKIRSPGSISAVCGACDSKILLESEQSERHPDLAVYTTPMPDEDEIWSIWIPTIAIEIVSESSIKRDYEEKPGEYLAFGMQEYWIVDGMKKQMTVLTRFRGIWREKVFKSSQKYTTRHLPGFSLDLKRIFTASKSG